jgi:hypothetical protein
VANVQRAIVNGLTNEYISPKRTQRHELSEDCIEALVAVALI